MLGAALRETGLAIADIRAIAKAAEDMGYANLWFPEVGVRDSFVLAAIAGAATDRIGVGTGVVPMWSRTPTAIAIASSTVAHATENRFVLGIGTGTPAMAQAWFGSVWSHPRTRLRETVLVVRDILSGERVTHHGEIRVEGFHLATGKADVQIVIGALSPASLRLAGQVADGAILNWLPASGIQRSTLLVREAAGDAGRVAKVYAYVRAALAETPTELDDARAAMHEQAYMYAHLPAYARSMRDAGLGPILDAIDHGSERALDALVAEVAAVGSTDAVRFTIDACRQAGADQVVVYPVPYGDDPARSVVRTLRAAAGE